MKSTEERIKEIIEKLRPYLISDGGNIEFVKYEDNTLYITLTGNCENCPLIDVTLKDGIEQMITTEIPEVKEVCLYNKEQQKKKMKINSSFFIIFF